MDNSLTAIVVALVLSLAALRGLAALYVDLGLNRARETRDFLLPVVIFALSVVSVVWAMGEVAAASGHLAYFKGWHEQYEKDQAFEARLKKESEERRRGH